MLYVNVVSRETSQEFLVSQGFLAETADFSARLPGKTESTSLAYLPSRTSNTSLAYLPSRTSSTLMSLGDTPGIRLA